MNNLIKFFFQKYANVFYNSPSCMSVYLEKWTIWSIFHGAHVHLPVEYFFNLQKITNFRRKHEYFQKKDDNFDSKMSWKIHKRRILEYEPVCLSNPPSRHQNLIFFTKINIVFENFNDIKNMKKYIFFLIFENYFMYLRAIIFRLDVFTRGDPMI